ncbi:MAG: tetratricopeptide repeat protein [Candidatus Magasanikbacteria bacterium]
MFNLIPFILIAGAIIVLIIIIIQKFPQLTLLDVDNIPEVVAEKKKDTIIKKRIEKKSVEQRKAMKKFSKPILEMLKKVQLQFRKYVGKVERNVVKERSGRILRRKESGKPPKRVNDTKEILRYAKEMAEQGDLDLAEQKCISVIRIEPKNVEAFEILAEVYVGQKQFDEAKETYEFLLQLDPKHENAMIKLSEILEERGDVEGSLKLYENLVLQNPNISSRFAKMGDLFIQIGQYDTAYEAVIQASELEPENPKYLDMLTETSILSGKQEQAQEAYERLRMANPENQKLRSFRERIDKMV